LKAGLEVLSNRVTEAREVGGYEDMLKDAFAPLAQGRDLMPEGAAIGEQAKTRARHTPYPRMEYQTRRMSLIESIKDIYTTEYDKARARVDQSSDLAQPSTNTERSRNMDEDMIDALISAMNRYAPHENDVHDVERPHEIVRSLYAEAKKVELSADQQIQADIIAQHMAQERALTDLRIEVAHEVKPDAENYEWKQCIYKKDAPFTIRDPNAARTFRSIFSERKKTVIAKVSDIDKVVSRMSILAMNGPDDVQMVGDALRYGGEFEELTPEGGMQARAARQSVVERILSAEDGQARDAKEPQALLEDLYKGYSLKEITALARPEEVIPSDAPKLSSADRERLAKRILDLSKASAPRNAPQHSPLFAREIELGPRLGLDRDKNRDGPYLDGPSRG
ncbi:hypothetical protein, partial [Yoonia sp. R2-816]|uniref:hypothetical protein n=1 Tax=Yoonia sp. R2-816 TaxID=3342638 RepID=UPI0037289B62